MISYDFIFYLKKNVYNHMNSYIIIIIISTKIYFTINISY